MNDLFKDLIFTIIHKKVDRLYERSITEFNLKTIKGNTQNSERNSIILVKTVLDELSINYKQASSQQSKDFRIEILKNIYLNIEIKKTDSKNVFFNDTMPNKDIYYIILFTGNKTIKPKCIGINGYELIKNDLWIFEYQKELNIIKDKYCGIKSTVTKHYMKVYPRPTYKSDIGYLLIYK